MSALTAPFRFVARVLLWIFLLPVGIWRSVVNRRKKEHRREIRVVNRVGKIVESAKVRRKSSKPAARRG